MAITAITRDFGADPSIVRMVTTDAYSTMIASGYLTDQLAVIEALNMGAFEWRANDIVAASYANNATALFNVSSDFADLVPFADAGEVVLPTIANHIATYTNTTGQLSEDAATAINGGNIQAGLSGTAGYVASFPGTAAKGSLRMVAADNTGDTLVTITNAEHGQATVVTLPDMGAATSSLVQGAAAFQLLGGTTAAYGGGGTSNAYTATGLVATDHVSASISAQAGTASIVSVLPGTDTLTVTFSADPGAGTIVRYTGVRSL